MASETFRRALKIVAVLFVLILVAGLFLYIQVRGYPDDAMDGNGEVVSITIPSGASFPQIAQLLAEHKLIRKPTWFQYYGMSEGATTKVRSGKYQIPNNMSASQVLEILLKGVPEKTLKVTIPEGLHMLEVFAILENEGVASANELERLARSPEFLREYGIGAPTLDGYMFPDTYQFRQNDSPKRVLNKLIVRHRTVWDEVMKKNKKNANKVMSKLKWNERELLTLASIVEKEAVVASERPTIAQVFINRLVSPSFVPHRLDTDPTIRYGCTIPEKKSAACKKWDPSKRLRTAQLRDKDNPYNTYQHEGLPPGPICNPGRAAMAATMNPDGTGYFYFVSRNNGTHIFSKTFAEHDRNVTKFQRNK